MNTKPILQTLGLLTIFLINSLLTRELRAAVTVDPSVIAAYADYLSSQYNVPSVIIKAILEQESGWNPNVPNNNGSIDLMQITPPNGSNEFYLGSVNKSQSDGENDFTITAANEPVVLSQVADPNEWRYNMEVGVRILLGKVKLSHSDYLDLHLLENWYYAIAYYNGSANAQ